MPLHQVCGQLYERALPDSSSLGAAVTVCPQPSILLRLGAVEFSHWPKNHCLESV